MDSYKVIGDMYYYSDYPPDSSMLYYAKAAHLAATLKDWTMLSTIRGKMGFVLYPSEPKRAISLFREASERDSTNRNLYNIYLSYTYVQIQKADSASYFLRLAERSKEGIQDSLAYFLSRSYIGGTRKDYRQAFEDFQRAYFFNEKDLQKKEQNQLYRIDRQYDLTEQQNENLELKVANQNKTLLISAMVILLLGLFIFFLIKRSKSKRRRAQLEARNKALQYEMELRRIESKQKQELLLEKLKQKLALTLQFRKIQDRPLPVEKQGEIMDQIIQAVVLHKKEWEYYTNEVNELSGNGLTKLQETHPCLTKSDLIVIALIYLGIGISDSCLLLNMNKETMYTRRKRIRKHLSIDEQTELEKWLLHHLPVMEKVHPVI